MKRGLRRNPTQHPAMLKMQHYMNQLIGQMRKLDKLNKNTPTLDACFDTRGHIYVLLKFQYIVEVNACLGLFDVSLSAN